MVIVIGLMGGKAVITFLVKEIIIHTAKYWEYDSRIGRRRNLDPKPNIGRRSNSVFIDNPILLNDSKGDTAIFSSEGKVTRNDKNGDGLVFYGHNVTEKGKNLYKLDRFYLNDLPMDAKAGE